MKKKIYIITVSILMILIDASGQFSYLQRSIIKLSVFGLIPFMLIYKTNKKYPNLRPNKYFKLILGLSIFVIVAVFIGAAILNNFDLLSFVKKSLETQVGVNKNNFPYIFLYIVLINGPLEEFFFRYFANDKTLFGSVLFSVYHVGMLFTMFPWYIFIMAIFGLILVGFVFSFINGEDDSILNSIIVHMAANIAINGVGWFLIMG